MSARKIGPLGAAELARRKPVWSALSELWLDTELDRGDLAPIVDVLTASPYDVAELREIYLWEVAPVVAANLWSPAGAWSGFDADWLHVEARKRAERRSLWLRLWIASGLGRKAMTYATDAHWREIEASVGRRRESAP
jgi:hypothetical protein